MIDGAFKLWLEAGGFMDVNVAGFPDFRGMLQYALNDRPEGDVGIFGETGEPTYRGELQLRTRANNVVAARESGRVAFARILAARGKVLTWTDPRDATNTRGYNIQVLRIVNRPTWMPSDAPGEITSANMRYIVKEV